MDEFWNFWENASKSTFFSKFAMRRYRLLRDKYRDIPTDFAPMMTKSHLEASRDSSEDFAAELKSPLYLSNDASKIWAQYELSNLHESLTQYEESYVPEYSRRHGLFFTRPFMLMTSGQEAFDDYGAVIRIRTRASRLKRRWRIKFKEVGNYICGSICRKLHLRKCLPEITFAKISAGNHICENVCRKSHLRRRYNPKLSARDIPI